MKRQGAFSTLTLLLTLFASPSPRMSLVYFPVPISGQSDDLFLELTMPNPFTSKTVGTLAPLILQGKLNSALSHMSLPPTVRSPRSS